MSNFKKKNIKIPNQMKSRDENFKAYRLHRKDRRNTKIDKLKEKDYFEYLD
jgi:hypothetical protein